MKLYFAGINGYEETILKAPVPPKYLLVSFYYFDEKQVPLIESGQLSLIDSGAYTFMNAKKRDRNYEEYTNKYIDFINKYDIKHFFELDMDCEIGYENVKNLRAKLESRTGKRSIPVFHKSRGLKEWVEMCKEYDYVAIGTIHEYKNKHHVLKELLKIAREHKTKVHGLGFSIKSLKEFDFYSVDSSSWSIGRKYGTAAVFNGEYMKNYSKKNHRALVPDELDAHNLSEWTKYQQYLDRM